MTLMTSGINYNALQIYSKDSMTYLNAKIYKYKIIHPQLLNQIFSNA